MEFSEMFQQKQLKLECSLPITNVVKHINEGEYFNLFSKNLILNGTNSLLWFVLNFKKNINILLKKTGTIPGETFVLKLIPKQT